jgi:hypothetical protein
MMKEQGREHAMVVFQGKGIRRIWHGEEWWYSVVDVVGILSDSQDPGNYWKVLKHRLSKEGGDETVTNCNRLKLIAEDGKLRLTDCANTETLFRLIQSIPSKKAEPFKRWLAKVGYERVQEIENPELAQKRMRELYRAKGYSDIWIEKRLRGIAVRDELTGEWDKRGIETDIEFSILTAEISKATFGLTPSEYLAHKGLKRQNLRDHMNDLELIFTMLGEAATTEIARSTDAQGFDENRDAAKDGGAVSGEARRDLETRTGRTIISGENYLDIPEKVKRLNKKK